MEHNHKAIDMIQEALEQKDGYDDVRENIKQILVMQAIFIR